MMDRKQKKQFKEKYKHHFNQLKTLINELDPEGLIKAECPEDEYEFEIAEILAGMSKCDSEEKCKSLVAEVFNRAFGRKCDKGDYINLSEPIWEWWNKNAPPKREE